MRTIVHLPSAVLHANVSGATDAASTAKQWVLLLHGFPDSAAMWDSQVEALVAAGYAVLAPDMPGLGDGSTLLTPPPSELRSYRLRNIAAVMVQLLDCLGISSTTVVGHDWGAAVAWALAMQHPHRVERLVVMSVGHPGAVKDQRQLAAWWYQLFFCLPGAADALTADDWRLFKQVMGPSCSPERLQEYISRLSRPGTLDAALSWYRANTSAQHFAGAGRPLSDSEQRRQLLPMPVMGVWSSRDSALLEPQMTASSSFVAPGRWRYHRLEGVGHWVAIEAAQQLNELLLAFLADTAADVSGGQPRPKL